MPKKTIIIPSSARGEIMKAFLKDEKPLFGIHVLPLNAFKESLVYKELDTKAEKVKLFSDIQNHISKTNIYYEELKYPSFFYYFYDFSNLLIKNGVKADDLPEDDPDEMRKKEYQDKKEILSYILDSELAEKEIKKSFDNLKKVENLDIYDYFYPDFQDKRDIDFLVSKGASLIESERKETLDKSYVSITTNNNVREVISVAQMLVKEKANLDKYILMVNDEDNYYPIIERVFSYYRIPFVLSKKQNSIEAARFLALLRFIRKQDIRSFVSAYNHNAFGSSNYILTDYINSYGISYEQLLKPLNNTKKLKEDPKNTEFVENTFKYDLDRLIKVEERCEEIMYKEWEENNKKITKGIRKIIADPEFIALKSGKLKDQCKKAYSLLYGHLTDNITYAKRSEIEKVQNLIQSIVKDDNLDDKTFGILEYELSHLRINHRVEYLSDETKNLLTISDPYQNPINKEIAIIIGCTQQNYPKQIANTGFFDEKYIEKIKNFPKLIDRKDYFDKEYHRFINQFKKVYFSYPAASVDGAKYERSSLIADFDVNKDKDGRIVDEVWQYGEKSNYKAPDQHIRKETARKIYLKDNKLLGSPSSMQKYINCPFQYFLEKGCGIKEEEPLQIGANTIGTIQHRLAERFFNNEITLDKEELPQRFGPYFDFIKMILPNEADEIEAMKERLAWGFSQTADFLTKFKEHDEKNYSYKTEEKINYPFEQDGYDIVVNNGSIDRLDLNNDGEGFRIVDYKSSKKTISMKNVRKGLNFQLLVYMYCYYKLCLDNSKKELHPEMAAYLSMKNEKIKPKNNDEKAMTDQQLRRYKTRYDAYITKGTKTEDKEFNRFFNVSTKVEDILDFDQIKKLIPELYKAIGDRILEGDIRIESTEQHCKFCNFLDICHRVKEDCIEESEYEDLVKE